MEDQKRSLLAIGLILAFVYVWFEYFVPKPVPPTPTTESTAAGTAAPSPSAAPATATPVVAKSAATPPVHAPARKTVTESALAEIVWTDQPGVPEEIRLKNFKVDRKKDSAAVSVVPLRGKAPAPLRWTLDVDGAAFGEDGAAYELQSQEKESLTYARTLANGLTVRKTYGWSDGSYSIRQTVEIANPTGATVTVRPTVALSTGARAEKSGFMNPGDPIRVLAYVNDKSVRLTDSDVAKQKELPKGDISWAGFDSRYFLLAALPVEGKFSSFSVGSKFSEGEQAPELALNLEYLPKKLEAGASGRWVLDFYAGPKDIGILRAAGGTLDRAIDLGDWLGPIARPMLLFLRWLYGMIPNYGIAILLLTVLVRLLMFPLTQMQAKSMRKMTSHKPQMDALKEKYGDKKDVYQRELMAYMRTHRINPMGGCLLLLPQMPIFFALYRVLYNSIELRQAPFAFWIHDLSAHDPFFVLPVVLGAAMFFQQKLTPTPGADPAQAAMMKFMPVMFSVFMLFLPAGLNLYILVSTVWGVAQQYWTQRGALPAAQKATTKSAERKTLA